MSIKQFILATLLFVAPMSACSAKISGAGVLPYYYNVKEDQVYYLLGLEKTSKTWGDFGGGRDSGEKPSDCAVREMIEESVYTLKPLKKQIKAGLTKTTKSTNSRHGFALYITDASKMTGIWKIREAFLKARFESGHLTHHFREKIDVRWVSADDLEMARNEKMYTGKTAYVKLHTEPQKTSSSKTGRLRGAFAHALTALPDGPQIKSNLHNGFRHSHGQQFSENCKAKNH